MDSAGREFSVPGVDGADSDTRGLGISPGLWWVERVDAAKAADAAACRRAL